MGVQTLVKEALPEEKLYLKPYAVVDSPGVTASADLYLVRKSVLLPPLKASQA